MISISISIKFIIFHCRKRTVFHPHRGDARKGLHPLRVPVHVQGQDVPPVHSRRVRQRQGVVRDGGRRRGRGHHRPVGRLRLWQHQVLHSRRQAGGVIAAADFETAAASAGAETKVGVAQGKGHSRWDDVFLREKQQQLQSN